MAIAGFKHLCTPASVYLVISMIAIIAMAAQNYGNTELYCLGDFSCQVSSTLFIFILKVVYVLFWTWVLNLICKAGATSVSWFLVLLPFILFFVFLMALMFLKIK